MQRLRRKRDRFSLIMAAGLVFFTLAATLFSGPLRSEQEIPPAEQLRRALLARRQSPAFDLKIEEEAPGYYLLFLGRVEGPARMNGYLEDFKLEVMLEENRLFVKKQGDSNWLAAEELQLESLSSFLLNPLAILSLLPFDKKEVAGGKETKIGSVPCRIVYLSAREENFVRLLFPEIPFHLIREVLLTATMAEGNLNRMVVELIMDQPEGYSIKRIYTID